MTEESRIVPAGIEEHLLDEKQRLLATREWRRFNRAYQRLDDALYDNVTLPFDPRFNAVLWARDSASLCRQVAHSLVWMKAYGEYYKAKIPKGKRLSDPYFEVSYFADNAITRIHSCRDKLALSVWAYFVPFNPEQREQVLDFTAVMERLRQQVRFGLRLRGYKPFMPFLEVLETQKFRKVTQYRHLKIHRREPRIEIYGPAAHHGWDYMIPCLNKAEERALDRKLAKVYPDPAFRQHIKNACFVGGVLYNQRRLKNAIWSYGEVRNLVEDCLLRLLDSVRGCLRILRRRAPVRRRKREP